MQKFFIILLLGLSPIFSFAQQYSPQQSEVMMRMLVLRNALINKDSTELDDGMASDVSYGHTNGLIQTKAQLARSVMSKEQGMDQKKINGSLLQGKV